ncbi:potassium/proton antiporter [Salinarimonas sp.]|uniref:potassium/proton antiporter n=1 Tax=Salinarimonas sp. TaxID=2766526 RepID=UPI00391CA647
MEWMYAPILIGSALVIATIVTSLLAFRFGAPLLLIFLGVGLAAGESGLGIQFQDAEAAYFLGSLALAVILFDSGFGTSFRAFRRSAAPAIVLATLGVVLTTALVGLPAHFLFGLPLAEAMLIGAIVSSTDAAAVFFLLRVGGIRIREGVRSTLEVESGSNDPMAIFLTIVLVEIVASGSGDGAVHDLLVGFVRQMGVGLGAGLVGGSAIVWLANRLRFEGALNSIAILAFALLVFSITGLVGGSGFLAAYVAGLVAGNRPMPGAVPLRRFQEGITWLAQIAMFLMLGLLASPSQFPAIALPAIALALFLAFVGRPLAVWLCLLPFRYSRADTLFIGWVGLRGAVSILLGIIPILAAVPNGALYFNTAFIIVLTSLLLQGWTIRPLARWLGVLVPRRIGPVERVELELPGSEHHELVVYHVVAGSPVLAGERLPRWARPSLVIRDGQSMRYQYAGHLQEGDYVYMFIAPRYARLLDRLFAGSAPVDPDDHDFFGEFALDPAATLAQVIETYDVTPPRGVDPAIPLRDFVVKRLGGSVEVGDRVACGEVDIIVRAVDLSGGVGELGLALDRATEETSRLAALLDRLRATIRRRRGSGTAGRPRSSSRPRP